MTGIPWSLLLPRGRKRSRVRSHIEEIIDDLESALDQFRLIANGLGGHVTEAP
jgi:hypothetical protein